MMLENVNPALLGAEWPLTLRLVEDERALVARFVARVNALGPLDSASLAHQARLFEEVRYVARRIDLSAEMGLPSGYDRRVLHEDPADRWSLAAIIMRPGQETHAHDHGGWGCAVTVQGIERNRHLVHDGEGNLITLGWRDYPPGSGYSFSGDAVHQPYAADPSRVTVALHFLIHGGHEHPAHRVIELREQALDQAA